MTGRSDGDRAWSSLWIYRDTHLILLLLNCEGPPWQWVWESWLRLLTSQSLFSIGNMNDSEWKQHLFHHAYRVSELKFITKEAVDEKRAIINCKGKLRQVFLPKRLCKALMSYIKSNKIKKGPVFVTKNGNPLDRSNVWKMLKKLCDSANVTKEKVFLG